MIYLVIDAAVWLFLLLLLRHMVVWWCVGLLSLRGFWGGGLCAAVTAAAQPMHMCSKMYRTASRQAGKVKWEWVSPDGCLSCEQVIGTHRMPS